MSTGSRMASGEAWPVHTENDDDAAHHGSENARSMRAGVAVTTQSLSCVTIACGARAAASLSENSACSGLMRKNEIRNVINSAMTLRFNVREMEPGCFPAPGRHVFRLLMCVGQGACIASCDP